MEHVKWVMDFDLIIRQHSCVYFEFRYQENYSTLQFVYKSDFFMPHQFQLTTSKNIFCNHYEMATYSNVCRGIFKLEISCTSFLFKHTHNTINDNTNTCPQPLADLIWLNYRARKSGWFAINKRAKQLKQRPRTFDFSKTQTTSYCQEQQWSVHKTWWKKRRIQTQQKSSPIYTPFQSLTHYY